MRRAFNNRWYALCEEGGDDFNECELFDNLIEEVDSLAEAANTYEQEGRPGMSSTHTIYYTSSETEARNALARFLGSVR